MLFRGIIFDLDGTLLDTLPGIAAAVNHGLRDMGLSERPLADVRQWIGEGLPNLCRRALADAPHVAFDEMLAIVSQHFADHREEQTVLFPGVPEMLDALTACGVPMAILSNKPHEHAAPMVEMAFSRWPWVAVEGYRREDRRKPDPRTALDIVAAMQLSSAEVALLGDSDTDMRTAVNAGLIPIGALWGYRDRDVIETAGARYCIERPGDVLSLR